MIFKSVIDSSGVPFIAHMSTPGSYVDGDWIKGTVAPVELIGVILPLSEDILNYAEAGTFTTKEKKLLTVTAIPEGTKVEYKGNHYTIEAFKDYSDHTDVHIYVMRWRK